MGVIYKLKQEVIDFILQQKKTTPSLSCRRISTIIQEHFHIDVSKSAVNLVLKTNLLSSPVGRQPKKIKNKNFFIPLEKKEELRSKISFAMPKEINSTDNAKTDDMKNFDSFNQVWLDNNSVQKIEKAIIDDVPKVSLPTNVSSGILYEEGEAAGINVKTNGDGIVDDKCLKQNQCGENEQINDKSSQEIEELISINKEKVKTIWDELEFVTYSQAIAIWLVSMYWEMDRNQLLGKMLQDWININNKDISLEDIEGALIMRQYKTESVELRKSVMSGVAGLLECKEVNINESLTIIDNLLKVERQVIVLFESYLNSLSIEVGCYEFKTFEGKRWYVDVMWTKFSLEPFIGEAAGMYLGNAVDRLAREFINNIEPIVVNSFRDDISILDGELLEIMLTLSGLNQDYVDTVSILSKQGDRLAQFSTIPKISRGFLITGILLLEDAEKISFDTIAEMYKNISNIDGQIITYYKGKLIVEGGPILQVNVFKDSRTLQKRVLLTNISDSEWTTRSHMFYCSNKLNGMIDNALINKKFDLISTNRTLYVKIDCKNMVNVDALKASVVTLNRKRIVNQRNKTIHVVVSEG